MIDPLYSLSGFAVGALVGMTGVGGGSLMTPLLILLFGVHPATAVGTDLLYAAATKTGGSLVHGYARSIDWRVVRRLATGSVPATLVTLAVLSHFNLSGDAARNLITLVLSVALLATAFVLVFGEAIVAAYRARVAELDSQRTAVNTVLVGLRAWRTRLDFFGRRRRHRRDCIDHALPAASDGEDSGFRHRPCGATDADCRDRALDDGLGRLAHHGIVAGRLAARHLCWQLFRNTCARACSQAGACDNPVCRGEPHRLRPIACGVFDLYRLLRACQIIEVNGEV